MLKSKNLNFDFLESGQAQKHLTVNDALFRLDAMYGARYLDSGESLPETAGVGDCFVVPASDPDHGGDLAIASGGGYEFIEAKFGMRATNLSGHGYRYFGNNWKPDLGIELSTTDVTLTGASTTSSPIIKEKTIVLGVTARVISEITGTGLASWRLGVPDDPNRYGAGLWLGVNGWARGLTSSPLTYWQDTPLVVSANAGTFSTGVVRIFLYFMTLPLPPEV